MKYVRKLTRDESGIAGIEAAVLVLSFFVVSSVLGLTVIRLGASTSSQSTELIELHLTETTPAMKLKGTVMGIRAGDGQAVPYYVETITIPVVTRTATPVQLNADSLIITYYDREQFVEDLPWSARWIRGDNLYDLLGPGELAEITLQLADLNPKLAQATSFTLEFKPLQRDITTLKSATPTSLDPIVILE